MNTKIQTAFYLSICSIGGLSTYLLLLLLERFSVFYIDAHPSLTTLVYVSFVIGPFVLAIVCLNMVKGMRDVNNKERLFIKLTRLFSWLTLGSFILYTSLALILLALFGLSLIVI